MTLKQISVLGRKVDFVSGVVCRLFRPTGCSELVTSVCFQEELEKQQYYQRRNKQARKSHTNTRIKRLADIGIDVDQIKSCIPHPGDNDPSP